MDNLGPTTAMQVRSVPERIRDFYNDLARDEGKLTLGELLTRIATGATVVHTTVDGRPVTAVQTVVAAARAPSRLPVLLQAAEALAHVAQASGRPTPARTAASLNAAIAAEVRAMRRPAPLEHLPLLESDKAA